MKRDVEVKHLCGGGTWHGFKLNVNKLSVNVKRSWKKGKVKFSPFVIAGEKLICVKGK